MKQNHLKLTTAEFAKLHQINRRTLHYYDNIGLFSPYSKGNNGYRYYNLSQSMDFEYIRMLKELNMSIEEISDYYNHPSSDKFLAIVERKTIDIDKEIQKLTHIKKVMENKKKQVLFCQTLKDQEIRIESIDSTLLYTLPFTKQKDMPHLFSYIKDTWSIDQIRTGIGSFISLDKIKEKHFEEYDGLFTFALDSHSSSHSMLMNKGNYLCGYQTGTWDKLPFMYTKMLEYAKKNHLELTGYAYEIGLNEFVISNEEEYITKIMIKIA